MPSDVIMPALGMAQDTGVVVSWKKQPGDQVIKGEPLLEVETDKAVVDVESPATGTLGSVSAEAGAEVPVGTTIAIILGPGESSSPSPTGDRVSMQSVGAGSASLTGLSRRGEEASSSPPRSPGSSVARPAGEAGSPARLKPASPLARRLAAESGVHLAA